MTTEIHTLVGAYVLDAVDDLERTAFDRHLRECDSCREEVDELREATSRLAESTWSAPPPRLRENVLAEIGRTRQLPPQEERRSRDRTVSRWRRMAAAAAVVVAAAGTGTTVYAIQDHRVREQRAVAEAALAKETRVRAILAAGDLVVHEQQLTTGGQVTVATSAQHNAGVVMLAADGAPAGGRIYQLWTLRPNTDPVAVGVLAQGQTVDVQILEGLPGVAEVGVTIEPGRGATKPTLPMIADVKLV